MKSIFPAVAASAILAVSFIIGIIIFTSTWRSNYRSSQTINVTGSAKRELVSDLAILRITISAQSNTASGAYGELENQKPVLLNYLAVKGFTGDRVQRFPAFRQPIYEITSMGYQTNNAIGYIYTQRFEIQSDNVNLIKDISLDAASLVEKGLDVFVETPEYYYTKLAELKIEIQAEAAKDAMERASKIAEATGSELGTMTGARMGVLQITPLNSNFISDYGVNDVTSIQKEITAVVNATFIID